MSKIRHGKLILAVAVLSVIVLVSMTGIFSQSYEYKWWDVNWHYRRGIEINSTNFSRTDWPIEYEINFTSMLNGMGVYNGFDENSTRVFEYNSTGSLIGELPSQFDKGDNYNATTNAAGTVVFSMNGTTPANQKRYFFIYFDTLQYGSKSSATYATDLAYNYTGNIAEFNVNNSLFRWWVDTERAENTSGIYYVRNVRSNPDEENEMLRVDDSNKTVEYSEFSNASGRFGFDFRNNATFKYTGPVRIVVEQRGDEILWNQPDSKTNEGYMIKRYTFYRYSDWMKIEQIFVNNASYGITRNSTVAGALGMNVSFSFLAGGYDSYPNMTNPNDPGSYGWAAETTGTWWTGIVNVYENGTSNFFGLQDDATGRIGIQLNTTSIAAGSSMRHIAALQFNSSGHTGQEDYFRNFVNQSITPLNFTEHAAEAWTVITDGKFYMNSTNEAVVFNRNETVIIAANITDFYNLSDKVNVTVDMAGSGEMNLTLYDDGSHNDSLAGDNIYANAYDIKNSDAAGVWNVTYRTYNQSNYFLNTSHFAFNVTNVYNVTVNIINPTGFTERMVNATVYARNYRSDRWIAGAAINCTFASGEVPQQNISDLGNGSYRIWFTAPNYADLFVLNCSATRNNNTGWRTSEFTSETYYTNMSVTPTPSNLTAANVTAYSNQTFNISVLFQNTANGSAYDLNVSLNFSTSNITANATFVSCGGVLITKNCTKTFQIIVLNATPSGNYTANISARWRNANVSQPGYNFTIMNISILSNPIINVSKDYVLGIISAGKALKNIANFTVDSIGNMPLQNVNFTVLSFPGNFTFLFIPSSFPSVGVGLSQNVQIWINATSDTSPGEYNSTINVTSANAGYMIINTTIAVSGTNMTINLDKNNFTAENVSWYAGQSFVLSVNTTNIGNSTAYNATVRINFYTNNITANATFHSCGNVPKTSSCNPSFLINILPQTHSGNYTANVIIEWEDPESGISLNSTILNITVLSHINLTIPTNSISSNVTHGTEKQIGTMILNSTGNDPVENITFTPYNFSADFTFEFTPLNITSLGGEYAQGVKVNVTSRVGTPPGVYTGKINVTSANNGYKEVNVTIEVPTSRTWTLNTTYCERVMSPEEGTACDVLLNNTGNVVLNFTITPYANSTIMNNRTWINVTNFTVYNISDYAFSVYYNITNQTIKFYYANYTINSTGASPGSQILQVVLNPFIKPGAAISFSPNITEQLEQVWIYANITDQSGAGISGGNVTATVARPDGINNTVIMTFYGTASGGVTIWRARYPDDPNQGNWGNTSLKGYYNASIFVVDNQNKNNTVNSSFYVYHKLFVDLNTSRYSYRGDSLEIRIKSRDAVGTPLAGANVNLTLTDPNGGNKDYYMWGGKSFVTDANGDAGGFYLIPTNAILGNYTFSTNSSYNETSVNRIITNASFFQTEVRDASKVTARLDIPDPIYRDKVMPVSVFILDNGECMQSEPESIEITIYYTAGYSLQQWRKLTKLNLTQNSTCFYTYGELIGSNVLTGTYLAVLKINYGDKEAWDLKAFRITTGGPYDVAVNMLETEVSRSDYIDFELVLFNMGGTTPDVLVEYWISGANQTWDYRSESIMINAYDNRTLVRSLYIVSGQPLGQYFVNAKVTYDQVNNLFAVANASFLVVEDGAQKPPSPPGAAEEGGKGAAAPSASPKIEIVKYSSDLGMEMDTVKYPTFEVKNTGGSTLYNVTLKITGIPSPWIQDILPKKINSLAIGNSTTFTITLKIPPSTETKEYIGHVIADANVTKDDKSFSLTVFSTRAELIRWEIDRLKKALQELESDIEAARKAGKDLKDVTPYVDQIKEQIRLAEDYLEKKMYDDSLSAVHTGWSILEKARYLLAQAPFIEILIETIFPPWLILVLVVLVVAIGVLLFFVRKMKGVFDKIFRMQVPGSAGAVKTSIVVEKMKEKAYFEKEEANVRRVLGLLEREFKEGLISESAYADLKRRNEEKLAKIQERKTAMK